jgi:hypothetical protein
MPEVDYDKLARQHGGRVVEEPDYDALARQHGGAVLQDAPSAAPGPPGRRESEGTDSSLATLGRTLLRPDQTLLGAGKRLLEYGHRVSPAGLMGYPTPEGFKRAGPIQEGGASALDMAAYMTPGGSVRGLAGAAVQGAKAGGVAMLQGADPTVPAALGAAGPVAIPAVGKVVKKLLPAPAKQYAQALGATTKENKELSEKIVPELIGRRVTGSRERIAELAEKKIVEAGTKLDEALGKVPKGTAADVGAVLDQLQKLKRQYVVPSGQPGVNTIVDQPAYNALGEMQRIVAATKPTFESVRRLRQILDQTVTKGDKTFGRTIAEGSTLDATREAANAIRRELAKAAPDVARINKEFSFWKDVERVVNATIQRTASQSKPLGAQIAEGVATPAVVTGTILGGPGGGIAATTGALVALRRLVSSPQWKTFSAVQKDKLAEAIARGDAQEVGSLVGRALAGVTAGLRSRDDQP